MKFWTCVPRHAKRIVLVLFLIGVLSACSQRHALLSAAGRILNVSTPLKEPVDCVMVLGGWANTRAFTAAEIMKAGLARNVLLARFHEIGATRDDIYPSEDDLIRQVLIQSGVSPDAFISLDRVVNSTQDEARCLADFLTLHPGVRVAVVTSDYHTRRARLLFSRACSPGTANLQYIGAPTDGFDASNWWQYETGVVNYLTEYLKLARDYVL
jgi:uncharacterized SAM-binding protein YcdF (DUF218 family)